eukprot:scaffold778_cov263-Pinguiococcus_pyrenoidosus.AAC.2
MLCELAQQAGLPDGVLNVVHGTHRTVDFLCTEPRIKAISFVGGDSAGRHIFELGKSAATSWRKKVQPIEQAVVAQGRATARRCRPTRLRRTT